MSSKHFCRALGLGLAALFAITVPAHADWAVLRNGERLHITGFDCRASLCTLRLAGGEVRLPASQIARFEPEDVFAPPVLQPAKASGPFGPLVARAARKNGLSPKLLSSVIQAESNFHPHAVSPKGALGLMQLMPATARDLAVAHPFNPSENVQGGARYLKGLLKQFGDLNLALAAYNAGPATVRLYGGVPPFPETQAYIARIRRDLRRTPPAPDAKTGTVRLLCSPLKAQCREQAVKNAPKSAPAIP